MVSIGDLPKESYRMVTRFGVPATAMCPSSRMKTAKARKEMCRILVPQRSEAGLQEGIEHFQQAVAIDPSYAPAYAGLADSYTTMGYWSYIAPKEAFPQARAAALKALELDNTLAEPHASLAYVRFYYDWDWPGSEAEFKQAIAFNPSYAAAHDWYSYYLAAMGRPEEALVEIRRAQESDPLSLVISTDMGFQLYYNRRDDEAILQLRKTLQMNPKFPLAHLWLGRAYQQKKMYEEAIAEYRQTDAALPNWAVTLAAIGNVEGIAGKKKEARDMLAKLNTLSQKKYITPYGVALVGLGDEFNTRWDRYRRWPTREDVVRSFCIEFRAHLHAKVVGLSAKQLRVNRVHELADAINL